MKDFFSSVFSKFKEYIVLILLLTISLSLLSLNEKPGMRKIHKLAFGSFAVVNNVMLEIANFITDNKRINKLEKENAELMLTINRLRERGLENEELKRMLQLKDSTNFSLIPAGIVSKSSSKLQGYLIINVGKDQEVNADLPVINHRGLVGIVRSSSSEFSLVRTLRNSKLKAAVRNQRSGFSGILVFDGIKLSIKNIPAAADMKIGDRIVTSEFSTLFPPSIPVGVITAEEQDLSGLLNNVIIKPFVDFNNIQNVFVLRFPQTNQVDSLAVETSK